ncbi:MAG TPA: trehalose-6-phosphate synthase, partial [Flavisolibacter sp.]|nr:trehalose-6-phosphate synthase [Flavisolibacter sp.]
MNRLLIISNRLPFAIEQTDEGVAIRQSSGGLVSAIKSYFERSDKQSEEYAEKIWIGTMDGSEEEWKTAAVQNTITNDFQIEPIFPDKNQYEDYYNGFSNSTLWPIFHYFPSLVEYK